MLLAPFCYLEKFKKQPALHDKIEFQLLFTCVTFSTKKNMREKLRNVLSKKEITKFYNELVKISNKASSRYISWVIYLRTKRNITEKINLPIIITEYIILKIIP